MTHLFAVKQYLTITIVITTYNCILYVLLAYFVDLMELENKTTTVNLSQILIFIAYIVDMALIPILRNCNLGENYRKDSFLSSYILVGYYTDLTPTWF